MEQTTESAEQKRTVEDNGCNESNDIEKQLPAALVEKSPEPNKKKKKISNENGSPPQNSISKKRKVPRDPNAPKYWRTGIICVAQWRAIRHSQSENIHKRNTDLSLGYVRFTTERRDILKVECPELSVLEVTKKMAEEWNSMADEIKKPYLEAGDKDKDRYVCHVRAPSAQIQLANAESDPKCIFH